MLVNKLVNYLVMKYYTLNEENCHEEITDIQAMLHLLHGCKPVFMELEGIRVQIFPDKYVSELERKIKAK